METIHLWSEELEPKYLSQEKYYVDEDILKPDAISKVLKLIEKLKEVPFLDRETIITHKQIIVHEMYTDAYESQLNDDEDVSSSEYVFNVTERLSYDKYWKMTVIDDVGIILENTDGFQVKVFVLGGHPQILCSDFIFVNSDGSTTWENINDIYQMQNRILEYCFNQIH